MKIRAGKRNMLPLLILQVSYSMRVYVANMCVGVGAGAGAGGESSFRSITLLFRSFTTLAHHVM